MEIKVNRKCKSFSLGQLCATPGALEALEPIRVAEILARHVCGDWGECGAADAKENDYSTNHGFRILSVYWIDEDNRDKGRVFIITEADRSSTCILLPSEY